MSIRIFFSMLTFLIWNVLYSQPDINQEVTLQYNNIPANVIFRDIQNQTGMVFSYSEFQDHQQMSIQVIKKPLKDVLPILETSLNIHISIKEKYIIVKPNKDATKKELSINGTITDPNSNEPLSDASIYVKKHRILVNSDKKGRFVFNVPSSAKQIKINIAKENYLDTSVVIVASQSQTLHIKMRSFPRQRISEFDSLPSKELLIGSITNDRIPASPEIVKSSYNENFWNKMKLKNVNLVNINDTIFKSFSVSLLPPISTNKLLSFHTRNTISLNIIGGNSKGLNGLEIGGVYNYDDGDVYGMQVAGVVNALSEDVVGTQISGVMNAVKGNVKGVQIAGVINNNDSITDGIQISGVYQKTHTLRGLQIGGLYNRAVKATGGQISGFLNTVDSATTFLQIAGLYNHGANIRGLQISGLVNTCDTLEGLQIGIFNRANHVKKGLSIGLINYVKTGYHKFEFSYNELSTTTIGYRSGWAPLHMHYFSGVNLVNKDLRFFQAGMGIASSLPLTKTINFEADANIRNTHDVDDFSSWDFNMYYQLMLGLSWQPFKKIGIRTGITLNHFWYNNTVDINNHVASLIDNPVYEKDGTSRNHKMWIGWHVGLLLF
ncbi:MAG: carboxypeptidase-like regulatory domain-containing protein [Saprospiraceae bacterium]|nr:carboxypeptidase-like regulatory domain-containing protein [Saprospiraceae bacterium]MBP6566319.1 carboxypeptidase-like regulatory domain-containing protein [Saprospiraceae bacterium]